MVPFDNTILYSRKTSIARSLGRGMVVFRELYSAILTYDFISILPLFMSRIYSFMFWKLGTSDLLVLMLFALQFTDFKKMFLLLLLLTLTLEVWPKFYTRSCAACSIVLYCTAMCREAILLSYFASLDQRESNYLQHKQHHQWNNRVASWSREPVPLRDTLCTWSYHHRHNHSAGKWHLDRGCPRNHRQPEERQR